MVNRVACLDVGSTYTKGALVDLKTGLLLAATSAPTTAGSDVLEGVDTVLAGLGAHDEARACSSAGGGLRVAVVGYELVVSAEAGRRAALSAGGRVVHVASGPLDGAAVAALGEERPDIVLLVGGTDGGNAEVLLHNARRLAAARLRVPVVVAGNAAAADAVRVALPRARVTANVLPRIGVLDPLPAREAIRAVFIDHVIGGKKLSRGPRFAALVRAATPDAVLAGVEVLAGVAGEVLVVDVGGATTDVYSVVEPREPGADVAGTAAALRTVEGDLGVRWSAPGVVEAARSERLLDVEDRPLAAAAARRAADPAYLPVSDADRDDDVRLAELAVTVALRRHARGGRDLSGVRLVVGSGGVLRHSGQRGRDRLLRPAVEDLAGGWRLPAGPTLVVDERYVLAAAGLLAADHSQAAALLLGQTLLRARRPRRRCR